ncbi:MAG TPA: hypothetical protein VIH40_01335 [Xanthobacteraceae bacterium]
MRRDDLIRTLRAYARERNLRFEVDTRKGKGSHYRVRLGDRVTTVQYGELSPVHVMRICKQLAVEPHDL